VTKKTTDDLWSTFLATVDRCPDRVAFQVREEATTFSELRSRALEFASHFQSLGLERGDRVMLCLEPGIEMAAAALGTWACAAIAALMDSAERGCHLEHGIDSTSPAIIVEPPNPPVARPNARCPTVSSQDVEPGSLAFEPVEPARSNDPASILFTSGSTGRPKGVTQSHGSLIRANAAVAETIGLRDDDRIVCPIPWSFDYGYGQLLTTLMRGTTHVLPTLSDTAGLCRAIESHRPTVFPGIPSLFTFLLRGPVPFANADLSSLRIVTNTGGTIPEPILDEMHDVFGHCDIFLNYGLTESYRTSCLPAHELKTAQKSMVQCIGRPIRGVEILVLRKDGTAADDGEIGEIVHRGDYLFTEYWNDPDGTAQRLRPYPLEEDDRRERVLFTGDLGWRDTDGLFYYHCRQDRLLKSMGVRVNPNEVEELLHATKILREVAVFGRPNDLIGQEIWAAIVPINDGAETLRQIRAHAHQTMSRYMKPRRFLVLEEMPRTRTGKVDYPALEALADENPTVSLVR
jgi:long-chain acyl-CoA synthetase